MESKEKLVPRNNKVHLSTYDYVSEYYAEKGHSMSSFIRNILVKEVKRIEKERKGN